MRPSVKRLSIAAFQVVLAAATLLAARPALATWECSCVDIKAFKRRIAEVQAHLSGYRQLLADTYSSDAPSTFREGKQRWDRYVFGGERPPNVKDAGTASVFGTNATSEFEDAYCREIVKAVRDVHELNHERFMWINMLPLLGGVIASGESPEKYMLRRFALAEVLAHEEELEYLQRALSRLQNTCNEWKCRCNQKMYSDVVECSRLCPPARVGQCPAPTCLEIDRKTGKWTGKGY